jgi:hypothetical protein
MVPALIAAVTAGCANSTSERFEQVDFDSLEEQLSAFGGVNFFDTGEVIGVCFLGNGLTSQKEVFKKAVFRTWQFAADIRINWIDECPADDTPLVRVGLKSDRESTDVQDGWASGVGESALKDGDVRITAFTGDPFNEKPSIKLYLRSDGSGVSRLEYLAVHEFGHTLGFQHEQDHPNADTCDGSPSGTALTDYDADSIMNYCGSHGNSAGVMTERDLQGAQSVYGVSGRYWAAVVGLAQ